MMTDPVEAALLVLRSKRAADAELRNLAEAAYDDGLAPPWHRAHTLPLKFLGSEDSALVAALSPSVVLRLLDWNALVYDADEALLEQPEYPWTEGDSAEAREARAYNRALALAKRAVLARYSAPAPTEGAETP